MVPIAASRKQQPLLPSYTSAEHIFMHNPPLLKRSSKLSWQSAVVARCICALLYYQVAAIMYYRKTKLCLSKLQSLTANADANIVSSADDCGAPTVSMVSSCEVGADPFFPLPPFTGDGTAATFAASLDLAASARCSSPAHVSTNRHMA